MARPDSLSCSKVSPFSGEPSPAGQTEGWRLHSLQPVVEVEFPGGARVYLEEVVRSSLHPGSAEAAQQLLEGTCRVKETSQSVWDHRVLYDKALAWFLEEAVA